MKRAPDRVLPVMTPTPPIRMGVQRAGGDSRLDLALTLFLRVVAALWFAEGVVQWMVVLTEPDLTFLNDATSVHLTALFFFCILDFVAAVGLWLESRWGVAVWLATIGGHLAMAALGGGLLVEPAVLLVDAALVAGAGTLVWFTRRDQHRA